MGWLSGWQYRKSHVINPASGAGTNYQIRIKVNYGSGTDSGENVYLNGKCRSDFGDIRFTGSDGVTLLDYWMETKVDGNYAVFWVEVADDLSSNPATIYVYYGNYQATTTSNGENTFLFFDDFPGTTYDPDKWVVVGSPTINVSNSELMLQRDSYSGSWSIHGLRSKTFQMDEKRVLVKMKSSNASMGYVAVRADYDHYSVGRCEKMTVEQGYVRITADKRDVGGSYNYANLQSASSNTYYIIYGIRWGTSYFKGYVDGIYKGRVTTYLNDGSAYIGLFIEEWGTHTTIIGTFDWIAVAKFVDPEPSHGAWGSEETAPVEIIVANDFPMQYLAEPATAKELKSKVSGATITHITKDFPETLIKTNKAKELRSKFTI